MAESMTNAELRKAQRGARTAFSATKTARPIPNPSPNKYNAVKTTCVGRETHLHDSQREARRCEELQLMVKAGIITELTNQPVFDLVINGQKVCAYRGDFRYRDRGVLVVEDVKGHATALYRLKKKLMKALLEIEILET
jgi:hypothetical protein